MQITPSEKIQIGTKNLSYFNHICEVSQRYSKKIQKQQAKNHFSDMNIVMGQGQLILSDTILIETKAYLTLIISVKFHQDISNNKGSTGEKTTFRTLTSAITLSDIIKICPQSQVRYSQNKCKCKI